MDMGRDNHSGSTNGSDASLLVQHPGDGKTGALDGSIGMHSGISNADFPPPEQSAMHPATIDFDLTSTFLLHCSLLNVGKQYADATGFILSDHPKAYFTDKSWPYPGEDTPFVTNTPRRGYLICSPKSHGRAKGSKCPFRLYYAWDVKVGCFVFKPDGTCLKHSHNTAPSLLVIGDKEEIALAQFLTPDEEAYIKEQCLSRVNVPNMQINLERTFTGRAFSPRLLYNLRKKHLDAKYGKDRMELNEVFVKGDLIRQNGGIFVAVPSPEDFGLDAMHCQTRLMGEYADVYRAFKMCDGTHHLSQHDFQFIFHFVVDCLLRSKISGYTACFTENQIPIIQGAELFYPKEVKNKSSHDDSNDRQLLVEELDGFFDPFVDNAIEEDDEDEEQSDDNNNGGKSVIC